MDEAIGPPPPAAPGAADRLPGPLGGLSLSDSPLILGNRRFAEGMGIWCAFCSRDARQSVSSRGRRLAVVRQSGEGVSSKGAPPSARCTHRRAFIQRNFTVGTAMPSSAAASACDIS